MRGKEEGRSKGVKRGGRRRERKGSEGEGHTVVKHYP